MARRPFPKLNWDESDGWPLARSLVNLPFGFRFLSTLRPYCRSCQLADRISTRSFRISFSFIGNATVLLNDKFPIEPGSLDLRIWLICCCTEGLTQLDLWWVVPVVVLLDSGWLLLFPNLECLFVAPVLFFWTWSVSLLLPSCSS